MKPLKLSTSVPQTLSSSVTSQPNVIQQARAKQKMGELKQLYAQYGAESQEYVSALNAANDQFQYYSFWQVNPEEEEISQIQQRDYSQDEPFMLMRSDPMGLAEKYRSGAYSDYFKANPYAKDLIDKWYQDVIISKEKQDVVRTIDIIQSKAKGLKRYGQNVDVTPLQLEFESLQLQSLEQEKEKTEQIASIREEEKTYYEGEQARLQDVWSRFDTQLGSFHQTGDFSERIDQVNQFVTANEELIASSVKNYRKYENLVSTIDDPYKYAFSYLDNPEYELVTENGKQIIRKKAQQYSSLYETSRWQTEYVTGSGRIGYRTDSSRREEFSYYFPHELIIENNKLVSEQFITPYEREYIHSPIDTLSIHELLPIKKLTFTDNKLATKSEFGTFTNIQQRQFDYEWSGRDRIGTETYYFKSPYQSSFTDYITGIGWSVQRPQGEMTWIDATSKTKKIQEAQDIKKLDVVILPSNLFGTAKNILKPGEFEIQRPLSMKPQQQVQQQAQNLNFPIFPYQQPKPQQQSIYIPKNQKYIFKQSKIPNKSVKFNPLQRFTDPFSMFRL